MTLDQVKYVMWTPFIFTAQCVAVLVETGSLKAVKAEVLGYPKEFMDALEFLGASDDE